MEKGVAVLEQFRMQGSDQIRQGGLFFDKDRAARRQDAIGKGRRFHGLLYRPTRRVLADTIPGAP